MPLPSPQSPLLTSYYYATTVRIRPTTYHPTTPVPSELGLQPLFFVQPCSVATSAAHPTRYFHPLETRGRSREECTVKGGGTVQRWSEGKTSKTRRDFCFSLWRFRQVFTPSSDRVSFYRCLYFLSFCSSHSFYGVILLSLRNIMNLRFDGSILDKKSLSSHRREFDILILVELES